jgi:hypothetical protein
MSTTGHVMGSATKEAGRLRSYHPGPPLGAPAVAFAAFFLAGILIGPVSGIGAIPSPYSPAAVIRSYFAAGGTALVVGGFLQFMAGISLVVFSAIALSRLQFLAPHAPGPLLGGLGSLVAALLLSLSGLLQLALSRPAALAEPALVQVLQYLMFVTGGPAHTCALGIGVIGIAVSTFFLGRLARWIPVAGIVVGIIAFLTCLALAVPALAPVIPIGRFLAVIWILVVALRLPRNRAARRLRPDAVASAPGG